LNESSPSDTRPSLEADQTPDDHRESTRFDVETKLFKKAAMPGVHTVESTDALAGSLDT